MSGPTEAYTAPFPTEAVAEASEQTAATTDGAIVGETHEPVEVTITNPTELTRTYKVIKSLLLLEIWISKGVATAIITPTMLDLSELLEVNIAQLSVGCLVSKGAGMLLGSPIGGVIADKYRRHLDVILAVEVGLTCLSMAAVPWAPSLPLAGLLFAISGAAGVASSASGNPMILTMWGEHASSPLQFIHGGFGIGLLITPLFCAPYLSGNASTTATYQMMSSYDSMTSELTSSFWHHDSENVQMKSQNSSFDGWNKGAAQIRLPYGLCGLLGLVGAAGLLIFYFVGSSSGTQAAQTRERRTLRQLLHPGSFSPGRPVFGILMVVGLFFMYLALVCRGRTLNAFITSYAVQELGLTKARASLLTTTYFTCFTVGRYACVLLSLCLPVFATLFILLIGATTMVILLVLLGLHSETYFWLFTHLFGFFAAPTYPVGMAWANHYIEVSGVVVSVLDLGISVGNILCSWLAGYLYQYVDKVDVIRNVLYFSICLLTVATLLQILACRQGSRWREAVQTEEEPEDNETSSIDERTPLLG